MKRLYLMRSATAIDSISEEMDFHRNLTQLGENDVTQMAQVIRQHNAKVDALISSPAKRALATARLMATTLIIPWSSCKTAMPLYKEGFYSLISEVNSLSDKHSSVLLVGHNPSLSQFANHLVEKNLFCFSTGAMCCFESDAKHWRDFCDSKPNLIFYDAPKYHRARQPRREIFEILSLR